MMPGMDISDYNTDLYLDMVETTILAPHFNVNLGNTNPQGGILTC